MGNCGCSLPITGVVTMLFIFSKHPKLMSPAVRSLWRPRVLKKCSPWFWWPAQSSPPQKDGSHPRLLFLNIWAIYIEATPKGSDSKGILSKWPKNLKLRIYNLKSPRYTKKRLPIKLAGFIKHERLGETIWTLPRRELKVGKGLSASGAVCQCRGVWDARWTKEKCSGSCHIPTKTIHIWVYERYTKNLHFPEMIYLYIYSTTFQP